MFSPYRDPDELPDGQTDTSTGGPSTGGPSISGPSSPKPYTPPTNSDYTTSTQQSGATQANTSSTDQPVPQTFSQMQEAGLARPPAPTTAATNDVLQPNTLTFDPVNTQQTPVGDAPPGPGPTPTSTPPPQTVAPSQGPVTAPPVYTGPKAQDEMPNSPYTPGSTVANPTLSTLSQADVAKYWAGDPAIVKYVQDKDAASKAAQNASVQSFDDDQNKAEWAQYANALNNQPGYAGSGMGYLDPNVMPAWFTGNATAPGQGGAATPTIANPVGGTYAPPNLGTVVSNTTQTAPTSQGGTTTTRPIAPNQTATDVGNQIPSTTPTTPTTIAPPATTGGTTGGTTGSTTGTTSPTTTPSNTPSNTFDVLKALTSGASGTGGGSDVQKATQSATLNLLKNPSPYSEDSVKDLYNWESGGIDDQYDQQLRDLGETMAKRGLGTSTINSDNVLKSNLARRSAKETLGENLDQNYAQTLGNYETGAVTAGNSVGSTAQQAQQSWIAQLMGYGQQAFNNDVTTQEVNQSQANSWQNYIMQLLGMGYSPTG